MKNPHLFSPHRPRRVSRRGPCVTKSSQRGLSQRTLRYRCLFISLIILLCTLSAIAQKQVKGKVKDKAGKPVEAANISLKDADGNILKFTRTDKTGVYSLAITETTNGLTLEATCIGYNKATVTLTDLSKNYDMILEESEMMLKEVKIKMPPTLKIRGDTLGYHVADFAGNQDRSIGDVLRKMPGIDIADDGTISYNGKNISNFYIDGDNLLDDRYNIASRSIPYNAVDQVQVIQKDQPVKMLRKNNTSENVALNLVIKDEFKLHVIGVSTTGLGVPDRYAEDGTAILLSKKVKFINNITGDNIGIDPGTDLISHSAPFAGNYFLSTDAAGNPQLPQNRYLFNNAGLINTNNLVNINKDLQLKTNIAYLYDVTRQQSQRLQQIFLPGQTVDYNNIQNNTITPQVLRAQFDFTENADKLYFKDVILLDYRPITTTSAFVINNAAANQVLQQQTLSLTNTLSYMLQFKSGNRVSLASTLNTTNKPESLTIRPGLDSVTFNNNIPYAGLDQYIKLPTQEARTNAFISFVKNKFTQNYNVGFDIQHQQLNSQLYSVQDNGLTGLVAPNTVNGLNWLKTKFYTGGTYSLTTSRVTATLQLPLSLNVINYQDKGNNLDQNLQKIFFDPYLSFSYQTGTQNKISLNYSFTNGLGLINNVYNGGILVNYQSLVANSAPLSSSKTQNVGAGYEFKNAAQLLFANFIASYNDMASTTIQSTIFNNNIQQTVLLDLPNHNRSLTLGASASKYIFELATTVKGGISYTERWSEQLQDNELFSASGETVTYKAGLIGRLVSFINWSYDMNYAVSGNKTENTTTSTNTALVQKSTLSFTTVKNVYFNVSGDYLYTYRPGQPNLKYVFADMNINYRLLKLKTDIMFSVNNIANVKTYTSIISSANSLTTGTYAIPGRVGMLKATFNF